MSKKIILLVLVSLIFNLGVASAQDKKAGALYSHEVIPCPDSILKGGGFNPGEYVNFYHLTNLGAEVDGETIDCGVVVVPENYAKPEGRTLELFYLRLRSSSQSPAPDPLVYLAGGPGSSGSHEVSGNAISLSNLNQIRERRDIIAYDQRGTGYSNYLLCAPFSSAIGVLLERSKDPAVIAEVKKETSDAITNFALQNGLCAGMYAALTDVDLGQYNSVASAQDILHLTEALGYTAGYNLYGTSYGTRLAQYAMRATPDKVRSVILDGTTLVNRPNAAVTFAKRYEHYLNIFAQCAADAACNAAYPNLKERFGTLLKALEKQPVTIDPPIVLDVQWAYGGNLPPVLTQIDPSFFVGLAGVNNILVNGGTANLVPRLILALEKGDIAYLRTIMGTKAPQAETAAPPPVASNPEQELPIEQPLFKGPISTLLMLAHILAADAESNIDTHWVSIVLDDFQARLLAGGNQADLIEDLIHLSVLPNTGTDAQLLLDFANKRLSKTAAEKANTLVASMTHADVRRTMWTIQDIAMKLGKPEARPSSSVMQNAVNCAEDLAFSTLKDSQDYLDSSPYPQLLTIPFAVNEAFFSSCTAFPPPLDKRFSEPVVSAIPTLIYQEALDVQTPLSWGMAAKAGLSHAYYVEWRNMGHVASSHDPHGCSGDIAAAFFDNPAQEPNTSCAQKPAYALKFVLPK